MPDGLALGEVTMRTSWNLEGGDCSTSAAGRWPTTAGLSYALRLLRSRLDGDGCICHQRDALVAERPRSAAIQPLARSGEHLVETGVARGVSRRQESCSGLERR